MGSFRSDLLLSILYWDSSDIENYDSTELKPNFYTCCCFIICLRKKVL